MTAATSRLRRRGIGAGVAALVGLTGLGFAAVPAQAAPGFDPSASANRIAGSDRYDTAAKAALSGWTTSSTVIVANGEVTGIDALAASYLAGVKDAPVLLTQKDSVPSQTASAIASLNPTTVIVLGDENAVSASTYASLVGTKTGQRIDGDNRFATAVEVAQEAGVAVPKTVFLARGDQYGAGQVAADALAAGSAAYKNKIPVLLTNSGSLPAETLQALTDAGVTNVWVLGDSNAISDTVFNAVDDIPTVTTIKRLEGSDRTATAAAIANETSFGFSKTWVGLANGFKIDALAAGPVAGKAGYPILLTENLVGVGTGTDAYLKANSTTLTNVKVFGDTNSVPTAITDVAKSSGGGDVSTVGSIAVTPTSAQSFLSGTYSATTPSTYVEYSATVPAGVSTVSIRLAPPADVQNASATPTFTKADGFNYAAFVDDASELGSLGIYRYNGIDGVVTNTTYIDNVPVVDGRVTFRVGSSGANTTGSAVPIVYQATTAGGNAVLPVNASGSATGVFGVGGAVTATPGAAAASATGGTVTAVTNSTFTATAAGSSAVYSFQAGDTYQINAASSTQAAFLAALSAGDTVVATNYVVPGTAGTRNVIFNITADKPAAPTAVNVVTRDADLNGTAESLRLTYSTATTGFPTSAAGAQYRVAPVTNGVVGTWGAWQNGTPSYSGTTGTIDIGSLPAAGSYVYQVHTYGLAGSVYSESSANSNTLTITGSSAPKAIYAAQTTAAGLNGTLDGGDVIKVVFDQAIGASVIGDTIQVRDADGTVQNLTATATTAGAGDVSFSTNTVATETVNGVVYAANRVLTVAIGASATLPTAVQAGTTAGVQYPATVVDQSGIGTGTNSNWDIAGSTDVTIS